MKDSRIWGSFSGFNIRRRSSTYFLIRRLSSGKLGTIKVIKDDVGNIGSEIVAHSQSRNLTVVTIGKGEIARFQTELEGFEVIWTGELGVEF